MIHPRHCHPLIRKGDEENPFECSGCKELGFGPSYQCEEDDCSFVLHECCFNARDEDPFRTHPFMSKCRFKFLYVPPGGPNSRFCDACGRDVRGFLYHDEHKRLDLHPCCMNLKSTMCDPDGTMQLILKKKVSYKCVKCERKELPQVQSKEPFKGWSYVSSCGNHTYHVYCVKKLIVDNWEKGHFNAAASSSTSLRGRSVFRDNTESPSTSTIIRSEQGISVFRDESASSLSTSSTSSSLSLVRITRPSTSSIRLLIKIAKIGFSVILSVLFGNPTPVVAAALAESLLD